MESVKRLHVMVGVLGVSIAGCGTDGVERGSEHSIEQLLRREATELWTQGNLAIIPELFADTTVSHAGEQVFPVTHEGNRRLVDTWRTAFPDLKMELEDVVQSGDKAAARYTVTGTHLGRLWGNEPTGKEFRFDQIYIVRVEEGRIAETWGVWDEYGFRQQLGLVESER